MTLIIRLAEKIPTLSRVEFTATQHLANDGGWDGRGKGHVQCRVERLRPYPLMRLHEQGRFTPESTGRPHTFTNVFRLTWGDEKVSLHHERRGIDSAVWLFDLLPDANSSSRLITAQPHLCGQDTYEATLTSIEDDIVLQWDIRGPRKQARLRYHYTRT